MTNKIIGTLTTFLIFNIKIFACTNFIISAGATTDGSVMITYSADSHVLYGELYYTPAGNYPAGSMLDIYEWDTGDFLGRIPQVAHTLSVVGNINEYQVSIGEQVGAGKSLLTQPDY
jgi:dipeptidase